MVQRPLPCPRLPSALSHPLPPCLSPSPEKRQSRPLSSLSVQQVTHVPFISLIITLFCRADVGVKTAVDVAVNEPSALKQQEETEEKKEEAVVLQAVKEYFPAVSVTEADPSEEMKPGCTKVFTPLAELTPESVQAVSANIEPLESDAPQKLVLPLLKLTPATPESLSPTIEPKVPESPALAASDVEPSAPESTKTLVLETSVSSVPEPSAPETLAPSVPELSVAEPSAPESLAPSVPGPSDAEPSVPESLAPSVPQPVAKPSVPESSVPEPLVAEPSAPESFDPSVPQSVAELSSQKSPEPSVVEPSTPESPPPSIPEPTVSDSPRAVIPPTTISESATLVSISSEPQVLESDLLSLTPESPAPVFSVTDSLAPMFQASVPESPGPDSPAKVSPPPDIPDLPVTDLLAPESATLVSSDQQPLVPVSPPQISVVTKTILNTAPEPEPESESSPNIR